MADKTLDLSQMFRNVFEHRFGWLNDQMARLTPLAEKIRTALQQSQDLTGDEYTVTFAAQPGYPYVPKADPVELEIRAPGIAGGAGELLCTLSVSLENPSQFIIEVNQDALPDSGISKATVSSELALMQTLTDIVACYVYRHDYRGNIKSADYAKFMPRTP